MLNTLTLTNFQKHRDLTVSFSGGLNLIVGENWAGKSTVQRAILYALFGASAVPTSADTLTTMGESGMQVVLSFGEYTVTRGRNKATLEGPQGVEATGQTSVTARIEEILGISAKNFLAFQVARQDEAGALLSLGAPKLAGYINAVTGVDLVDTVLDRAKDRLTETKASLADSESRVARYSELMDQLSRLAVSKAQAEEASLLKRQQAGRTQAAAQSTREMATRLYQRRQDAEDSLRSREVLERSVTDLTQQLQDLGDAPAAPEESSLVWLEQQFKEAQANQQRHRQLQEEIQAQSAKLEEANASIQTLEAAIAQQEPYDLSVVQAWANAAQANWQTAQAEVTRLESAAKSAICPTCQRPYDLAHPIDFAPQLEQAKSHLAEMETRRKEASGVVEAAEKADLHWRLLQSKLGQWMAYQADVLALLETSRGRLSGLEEPKTEAWLQPLSTELARGKAARQALFSFQQKQQVIAGLLGSAREALAKLAPPAVDLPSSEQVSTALEQANRCEVEAASAASDALAAERELQQVVGEWSLAQALQGPLEQKLARDREALGRKQQLEQLSKYLRDNRDRFSAEIWQQLLGYASEFIRVATQGSTTALQRTSDGDFQYLENDRVFPVELASGMQRAILGTGLKMAMSAALGGPADFLLFDEISASASDENSTLLTQVLAGIGQQVVLISHRQGDTVAADAVIEL